MLPGVVIAGICLSSVASAFAQFFNAPFSTGQFELSSSVQVDEIESDTRAYLERAKAFIAAQQWDEAIETLQRLLPKGAERVVAIEPHRYVNLALHCQQQIAALPPAALQLYRDRVDATARSWYEEAVSRRDRERLQRVVDEFFASSWGDDALLSLGELALERGDCTAARGAWETLIEFPPERVNAEAFERAYKRAGPGSPSAALLDRSYEKDESSYLLKPKQSLPDDLVGRLVAFWRENGITSSRISFPGTTVPLADVRARLVLVSILEGSLARAAGELDAFSKLHPQAEGTLGGRKVNYAAGLRSLMSSAAGWEISPTESGWPTFAGSSDRNKIGLHTLDIGLLAWPPITLGEPLVADAANLNAFSARRIAERPDGLLSYHPVVTGNLVLVSTDSQILAFDVRTGRPAFAGAPGRPAGEIYYDETLKTSRRSRGLLGVPRFTLTVDADRVFARLGSAITGRPMDATDAPPSALVCLNLAREGSLQWKAEPESPQWAFEGAPVADGPNVFVAMRKSDVHPQAHVACLDRDTGKIRWRRFICSADTPAGGQIDELTHNLLTLDHGRIYYNTNLGAVAALDAATGRIQWLSLYPRAQRVHDDVGQRTTATFLRDLNPCVSYRGLVLVAPTDSELLFALDAYSGRMRWQTHLADDAVHLLGVGKDNLIASGDSLWWINVYTGKVVGHFPEALPPVPPFGYGRGLLARGEVYWPTRDYLYVFDQAGPRTGLRLGKRSKIPLVEGRQASGGNLVLSDHAILIASGTKLYAFSSEDANQAPLAKKPAQRSSMKSPSGQDERLASGSAAD